jgi:hypothetical protein
LRDPARTDWRDAAAGHAKDGGLGVHLAHLEFGCST